MKTFSNSFNELIHDNQLFYLQVGPGRTILDRFVRQVADRMVCGLCFIYAVIEGELYILAAHGLTITQSVNIDIPAIDKLNIGMKFVEIPDLSQHPYFVDAPLVHNDPYWRYMICSPLPAFGLSGSNGFASIICIDSKAKQIVLEKTLEFKDLSLTANDLIGLLVENSKSARSEKNAQIPPTAVHTLRDSAIAHSFDGPVDINPVTRFLLDTLINKRRLLSRNDQSYLALRTWRSAIKPFQIDAMRAVKASPPQILLEQIADEMIASIAKIYGNMTNAVVVPVPCGHSGPGCFADRLAEQVARQMGLSFVRAFDCLQVNGSSHPKTNVRRPKMKLAEVVTQPVILIDDISTSGSHIAEARKLLEKTVENVWAVVWIAD